MIKRAIGFFRFILFFTIEILKANIEVARLILFVPLKEIKDGFVDYSIEDLTPLEALILSQVITLTPGTITVDLDEQNKLIHIHVLDLSNPLAIKNDLDNKFKPAIRRFTR